MKELCLCVVLPVTVKVMVRDSFNVGIIVCSKGGGGPVHRYSETWRNQVKAIPIVIINPEHSRAQQLGLLVVSLAMCTALGEQAAGVIDARLYH